MRHEWSTLTKARGFHEQECNHCGLYRTWYAQNGCWEYSKGLPISLDSELFHWSKVPKCKKQEKSDVMQNF